MTTFRESKETGDKLEKPFIRIFNDQCATHQIMKFGIESTNVGEHHGLVRFAEDPSSHFIRFLPDSVLIRKSDDEQSRGPKTALVEFKANATRIEDVLFTEIKQTYGNRQPPLRDEHDIFPAGRDSLALQEKLAEKMDIVVVVVAWKSHTKLLRAQYVNKIVVVNQHIPSPRGQGSGTPMTNTHFGTYEDAADFFEREFGIKRTALYSIKDELINTP